MASPQPGIPPTLLEVCMRLPHFFQRLVYVELDDEAWRTSLALTCHSLHHTLAEMHRALPEETTGGGPFFVQRFKDDWPNPQHRDFLRALERDLVRKVIDDNRSPRLIWCGRCMRLHDPEAPIDELRAGTLLRASHECAKLSLPIFGGTDVEGAEFPLAFHPMRMYFYYRYKQIARSWKPIGNEHQEYDVELKPGQWQAARSWQYVDNEHPEYGKDMKPDQWPCKWFKPYEQWAEEGRSSLKEGPRPVSFFSRIRYMAKTSPEGVFLGMIKTLEGEIPGRRHFPAHWERPCHHTLIQFLEAGNAMQVYQNTPRPQQRATRETINGSMNSKLGRLKLERSDISSTSGEDIWDKLFTCRECNREWMLECGAATAESEAYVRLRIWACIGWKDEVVDSSDVINGGGDFPCYQIREDRRTSLPPGTCMAQFGVVPPTTIREVLPPPSYSPRTVRFGGCRQYGRRGRKQRAT